MGMKGENTQFNLFCHPSGKDLICKITKNDVVVAKYVDRGIYQRSSQKIDCLQSKKGLNCKIGE